MRDPTAPLTRLVRLSLGLSGLSLLLNVALGYVVFAIVLAEPAQVAGVTDTTEGPATDPEGDYREEMRAAADKDYVFNIERALSRMDTCTFAWDFSAEPFLDSILFVVWTSGEKKRLKYHLNALSAARLCVKSGAKARYVKQK